MPLLNLQAGGAERPPHTAAAPRWQDASSSGSHTAVAAMRGGESGTDAGGKHMQALHGSWRSTAPQDVAAPSRATYLPPSTSCSWQLESMMLPSGSKHTNSPMSSLPSFTRICKNSAVLAYQAAEHLGSAAGGGRATSGVAAAAAAPRH